VLLAEELLILLIRESTGEIPKRTGTRRVLAAAVLAELAAAGRVAADVDPACLTVVNRAPLGDPVLDEALAAIEPGPVTAVVRLVMPGLLVRLLDRLAAQGVLMPRARRWVPVTSRFVWRVADTARREQLRARLAAVLLGEAQPDRWSATMIALLHAVDGVGEIVAEPAAQMRAEEISERHWPEGGVIKAVAEEIVPVRWVMTGAVMTVLLVGGVWLRRHG
jgi:golgi phosphoprotein 3